MTLHLPGGWANGGRGGDGLGFDLVPLNDSLRKFTVCFKNGVAMQWVLETERVHAVGDWASCPAFSQPLPPGLGNGCVIVLGAPGFAVETD